MAESRINKQNQFKILYYNSGGTEETWDTGLTISHVAFGIFVARRASGNAEMYYLCVTNNDVVAISDTTRITIENGKILFNLAIYHTVRGLVLLR